ncbi:related to MAG1 - 3-methyl-adenine DNA glycosylase [Ustilago trichophora]|uniref:Related to MAG1 - 3-methyl-adenine DNA glycosylase n=1 Tax=Ustilago trichophora TaxID=86804 RepID=A0A5C3DP94_9BASI|nr:related to MAG1 - 3-methyl-adenine DNA glycosylase [Ustilago trichophora]
MVLTRSRSATPAKSIAASFGPSSKASIATRSAPAKRNLQRSATDRETTASKSSASPRKRSRVDIEPASSSANAEAAKPARSAKVKAPEEPFVIPHDASEEDCLQRTTVPFPALPFDFEHARIHLCSVDDRFERLFRMIPVRCYEEALDASTSDTKDLNLFKTVTTSILGQQISWLAARSVLYKFCRLFSPDSMPEKPDFVGFPREQWPFPTPLMVLRTPDADLRAAGLSFAKIKYVKDLAARFVDGRLDIRQILELDDEEACVTELSKVKGVGRWTSEMILMFAMRKPDILPCADLGVQKGMLNFFLSDAQGPKISVKKRKPGEEEGEVEDKKVTKKQEGPLEPTEEKGDSVPLLVQTEVMPKPEPRFSSEQAEATLDHLIPDEHGLCRKVLETRVKGNKIKGGQYLSPDEMKALARKWSPYRSVACMFLWALVDT